MKYAVTVEYQTGRTTAREVETVEAPSPELAAERGEWQLAMRRDGTVAYISHYFACKVRPE